MFCKVCNKQFSSKYHLLRHLRESCPSRFNTTPQCVNKIKVSQPQTNEHVPSTSTAPEPTVADALPNTSTALESAAANTVPGPSSLVDCPVCGECVPKRNYVGHMRRNSHKIVESVLDEGVEQLHNIKKFSIVSYRFSSRHHHIDHSSFFSEIEVKVTSIISDHIKKWGGLKVNFELFSIFDDAFSELVYRGDNVVETFVIEKGEGVEKDVYLKLRFVDSFRFLPTSLDKLSQTLEHYQCNEIRKYFPDQLKFEQIRRKDVLLLADIFENFRKISFQNYKLDPAHYLTAPSLSWDAMLKKTGVTLELLTDVDMLHFFRKGIRGGVSQCSNRKSIANNQFVRGYDDSKPKSFIVYLDATNLYGWPCLKLSQRLSKNINHPVKEDLGNRSDELPYLNHDNYAHEWEHIFDDENGASGTNDHKETREIVEETCFPQMRKIELIPSSNEEWLAVAKEFEEKWDFPHVLGAMDGKHVQLQAPWSSGTE
ncbi:hypothetical protein NQ318_007507 [Aromia moschata]|uniref:C2H2-type domain-containing protein n=1 Tax=Aromia moschata TaxID=1265417 RepID=A0AAV8YDM1_9CUCU|nr:hypothetical protein NQ318_007507 [Aromia moschata]